MKKSTKPLVKPYVHALLCEDVREETGGTSSYIGVMTAGGIALPHVPSALSKFAVSIWIVLPMKAVFDSFIARVLLPDGSRLFEGEQRIAQISNIAPTNDADRKVINLVIRSANVMLLCEGEITVEVVLGRTTFLAASQSVALIGNVDPRLLPQSFSPSASPVMSNPTATEAK